MQTIGQNPQAQQIMAALQAHIAEHLGFNYRKQIEERLGADMTLPDAELPEEIEVQLSRLVAQAARQLTQQHIQQAQQQQAQQQAQDPLFQIEQQKLQTQQQEVQRKAQKDQADIQLAKGKLELEARKLVIEAQKSKTDMDNRQRMELLNKAIEMQNNATARTDKRNEARGNRRAAVLDKLMASKSEAAPKKKKE